MAVWQWVFARRPSWVGGCRPTRLSHLLPEDRWSIEYHGARVAWGVASEVLVARPSGEAR